MGRRLLAELATLHARLLQQLAVLLLRHALAPLLDDRTHELTFQPEGWPASVRNRTSALRETRGTGQAYRPQPRTPNPRNQADQVRLASTREASTSQGRSGCHHGRPPASVNLPARRAEPSRVPPFSRRNATQQPARPTGVKKRCPRRFDPSAPSTRRRSRRHQTQLGAPNRLGCALFHAAARRNNKPNPPA